MEEPAMAHHVAEHHDEPASAPSDMLIRTLALCAVEAVEGHRSIEQLGKWVTPSVLSALSEQRRLRMNRNTAYRDQRRLVASPGRLLSTQEFGAVHCSVVMHAAHRSFAVTMRLERVRQAWRATELFVL